jgi:hypothetical protein
VLRIYRETLSRFRAPKNESTRPSKRRVQDSDLDLVIPTRPLISLMKPTSRTINFSDESARTYQNQKFHLKTSHA